MSPMPETAILKCLYQKNNRKDTDMGQAKVSKDRREGKHLTQKERIQIEALLNAGVLPKEIAVLLGRSRRTVERERRRGEVEHRRSDWGTETVYNADRGQDVHDLCATAKGPQMKIDRNREMEEFICKRIAGKKESPAVIAVELKKRGEEWSVCAKTIYNYIEQGEIAGITNDDLWEKTLRAKGKRRKVKVCKKHPRRNSIENRPESVEDREEFGHWEIDLIAGPQGGSKAALLTLVERKTRMTIIRKLPDKTQGSVIRAINGIERKFGAVRFRKIFKTITSDNGSEFLDVEGLEGSCLS